MKIVEIKSEEPINFDVFIEGVEHKWIRSYIDVKSIPLFINEFMVLLDL